MELSNEHALQRAVTAHKEGKLQDAERLYRAILQSQPTHPDANHNLGVLAVSLNKADTALPFFKTALESNSEIEQFWFSYIDALIKAKNFNDAKLIIDQAKKQGVDQTKLKPFESRLLPKSQKPHARKSPPEELLKRLFRDYQSGQFGNAENLAKSIIDDFPEHDLAWKVLGTIFQATGRFSEALNANRRVVALSPQAAEAHFNLGNALKEMGRLPDAEASYKQAIALKPDLAEAHDNLGLTLQEMGRLNESETSLNQAISLKPELFGAYNNLGITLKELGRLDEAEACYNQAIALKPDLAEAHSNLGITLNELGRLNEARASLGKAVALEPDFAEAHSNLGNTNKELGRLEEAIVCYNQAIALKPNFAKAMFNLSITQSYMNDLEAEICSLQKTMLLDSDDYGLRAGVSLAICKFLEGDFAESEKLLMAVTKIQEKKSSESKVERVYWRFLSKILKWHEDKYPGNKKEKNDKDLYVIGESHSLSSHHLRIRRSGFDFFCSAKLIKGCKQWHLGNAFRNQYKHQFENIFLTLPKQSYVLVAIGEIDCRLDTGIIVHKRKFPEEQIKEIISNTIENYLNYIVNNNSNSQHKIAIQGVPCPNFDVRNYSEKDIRQLGEIIKIFNSELRIRSKNKGFGFLDTYQLTNKGDGMSNGSWHIDEHHLSPEGMQEAWRRSTFEKSYEQF